MIETRRYLRISLIAAAFFPVILTMFVCLYWILVHLITGGWYK